MFFLDKAVYSPHVEKNLFCICGPNLVILAWALSGWWVIARTNFNKLRIGYNFPYKLNLTLKVRINRPFKAIVNLTNVFCTLDPNLMILELESVTSYHMDRLAIHTQTQTDTLAKATTIPEVIGHFWSCLYWSVVLNLLQNLFNKMKTKLDILIVKYVPCIFLCCCLSVQGRLMQYCHVGYVGNGKDRLWSFHEPLKDWER